MVIKVGDVYNTNNDGYITIVEYINARKVVIKFNDGINYLKTVESCQIKRGTIKNPYKPNVFGVGFNGVGAFTCDRVGKNAIVYNAWVNMLRRCYDSKSVVRYPTYRDCTVCDEWLNYQNFAKWYTENEYYGLGYHLDKDILFNGNTIYSPETCCLVPSSVNALLTDRVNHRGVYPIGVNMDKNTNKFRVQLSVDGSRIYLGLFGCINEAKNIYKKEKEKNIKRVANIHKEKMDIKVYNALMNWVI